MFGLIINGYYYFSNLFNKGYLFFKSSIKKNKGLKFEISFQIKLKFVKNILFSVFILTHT
jgi:hypothetical protein